MADNKEDMFDAESLLSLLDEIQKNADKDDSIKEDDLISESDKSSADSLDNIFSDLGETLNKTLTQKHVISYNINDYSPEIYSDQQLREIRLGIEHRVQVDEYADVNLNGRQMRELRYGLERNLDISVYNNKFFRERQMKEIRIGLQDGLDVSSYAKLMYAATDMRKKRMKLYKEKYEGKYDDVSYDYDDKETGIHIYVEPGLMEAGIVIKTNLPEKFTREDLKALMYSYDITEGFNEKLIPQNLSNLPKGVKIPIMFGKEPVPGQDGYFEFAFPCDESSKPKIKEDGSVDYSPTRTYKSVKRGEVIVTLHEALTGEPGVTVTGLPIEGVYGTNPEPLHSDDLIMSRDKSYYMAKRDGFASMTNGQVRIVDNLTFKEDVTYYNGKISFDGNIEINASVRDRAQIFATGDIIVTGFVESAVLVAGGDIIITGGVNADENGSYVAKGNITAGFFENAKVDAGGNIETGYILNSNVVAGGTVKTNGKKALICGGRVIGKEGVFAGTIGSSAGTKTYIEVGGENESDNEEYFSLKSDKKNIEEEIDKIQSVMDGLLQKIGMVQSKSDENYLKLKQAIEGKKEAKEHILKKLEVLDAKRQARNSFIVEALHEVYENITVNINGNKLVTQESYSKATFRVQGRYVVVDTPDKK